MKLHRDVLCSLLAFTKLNVSKSGEHEFVKGAKVLILLHSIVIRCIRHAQMRELFVFVCHCRH